MTDFERAMKMYDDFGIPYTVQTRTDTRSPDQPQGIGLFCIAKSDDKVVGYSDFCTELMFDDNGKFIAMGIWE